LIYSISISWNINGISHNFLHNPYFRSPALNRAFSVLESVMLGFSQVFYENVHKRHHIGNADLPDNDGRTFDPLSIYRRGHAGHAENVWTYTFLSYLRDDPRETYNDIYRLSPREAYWGLVEIAVFVLTFTLAFVLNWKFMCYFLPFYYFGHCLSYLNGYYLHLGGNPNVPIAWGVSSYHKLYNWLWFNNGYHAEHHYRPRLHWTPDEGPARRNRRAATSRSASASSSPHTPWRSSTKTSAATSAKATRPSKPPRKTPFNRDLPSSRDTGFQPVPALLSSTNENPRALFAHRTPTPQFADRIHTCTVICPNSSASSTASIDAMSLSAWSSKPASESSLEPELASPWSPSQYGALFPPRPSPSPP